MVREAFVALGNKDVSAFKLIILKNKMEKEIVLVELNNPQNMKEVIVS